MKTNILFMLIIFSTVALAKFPLIKFNNLHGEFVDSQGTAYAESAKYDLEQVKIAHKEIEVQFNRVEKHLVIKDQNTTVELVFDFSFLNIFKSFAFDGVSIESSAKKFDVEIEKLDLYVEPKTYKAQDITVSTDLTAIASEDLPQGGDIDILDGFVLNGAVNFKRLVMGKVDAQNFLKGLIDENPSLNLNSEVINGLKGVKKIPLVLRNFSLSTERGSIKGRVLLDSWINANLYIGGKISHIQKQNQLKIVLTKAKLGVLSVRRFVLREVRKLKIEAVTVKGNVITIDMGKVLANSSGNTEEL